MDLPKKNWTVMVYMAAGDDAGLDAYAVSDLKEMELAGVTDEVNVVVQINRFWPARPQRYQILNGNATLARADIVKNDPRDLAEEAAATGTTTQQRPADTGDASMGDGPTLAAFLKWAARHYPAERYFLVLWGHAYGLGFGRDHGDPMTLKEMAAAIGAFKTANGGRNLDLLGANACAISYAEAAFELSPCVDYLVASQTAVPFAGWPYDSILGSLKAGVDGKEGVSPETLGRIVVDRYVTSFTTSPGGDRVAMSLLDLKQANELPSLVKELAAALLAAVNGTDAGAGDRRAYVRAAFLATAAGDVRPLLDMTDLADELVALCDDLKVLQPGLAVTDRLRVAAGEVQAFLKRTAESSFIAFKSAHPDLEGLNGLGIFAPFVTDERDLKRLGLSSDDAVTGRQRYTELGLVAGTQWPSLVFDVLRSSLPADVVAIIEGSGATTAADRSAVAQLLASVDSTFDTLDRTIAATKSRTLAQFNPATSAGSIPARAPARRPESIAKLARLQLLRHDALEALLKSEAESARTVGSGLTSPAQSTSQSTAADDRVGSTVDAFSDLEARLASMERCVRRTLTNGTFGLGPGLGAARLEDKANMGAGEDKANMGAGEDKANMGAGEDKANMGTGEDKANMGLPARAAVEASPAEVVAGLFGQVGRSLRKLETAMADVETIATVALLTAADASPLAVLRSTSLASRLDRAFRAVSDASAEARRTLRRVVAHPAYGIGPGLRGVGADERRELATTGGLSSTTLTLL